MDSTTPEREIDWWFLDLYITVRCPCGESFEDSCDEGYVICPRCETRYKFTHQLERVNKDDI